MPEHVTGRNSLVQWQGGCCFVSQRYKAVLFAAAATCLLNSRPASTSSRPRAVHTAPLAFNAADMPKIAKRLAGVF